MVLPLSAVLSLTVAASLRRAELNKCSFYKKKCVTKVCSVILSNLYVISLVNPQGMQ